MRPQTMAYDSYCLQQRCCTLSNSFFTFHPQNPHVVQNHNVRQIHLANFFKLFKNSNEKEANPQKDTQTLLSAIKTQVNASLEELSNYIRNLFFTALDKVESQIKLAQQMNYNFLHRAMAECNYQILKQLIQYQKRSQGDFKHYLLTKKAKNLEDFSSTFKINKQSLKNFIRELFDQDKILNPQHQQSKKIPGTQAIIQKKAEPMNYHKIIPQVPFEKKQPQKQVSVEGSNHRGLNETKIFVKQEDKEMIQIQSQQQVDFQELQSHEIQKWLEKHKLIKKDEKKKRKRRHVVEEIIAKSESEIIIKQSFTPTRTFSVIKKRCPALRAIHIFDKKFATKAIFKQLFNLYPKINRLTVNCQVDLKAFDQIRLLTLLNLKKFCPRWDFYNFHEDFMIQTYFPTKTFTQLKLKKPLNLNLTFLRGLPNNTYLWLFKKEQQDQEKLNESTAKLITQLEIYPTHVKQNYCQNIKNLKFLKVDGVQEDCPIYTSPQFAKILARRLTDLIRQNMFLQHIYLENLIVVNPDPVVVDSIYEQYDAMFQQISVLPRLRVFSLIQQNKESPFRIRPKNIARLDYKLAYLNLANVIISAENNAENRQCIHIFSTFSHLKHLSLYNCSDITSQHIINLHPNCLSNMQFLNLGATSVDQSCLYTISKMTKLFNLNLAYTVIQGKDFVKMLEMFESANGKKHQLKRLNIKAKHYPWKHAVLQNLLGQYKLRLMQNQVLPIIKSMGIMQPQGPAFLQPGMNELIQKSNQQKQCFLSPNIADVLGPYNYGQKITDQIILEYLIQHSSIQNVPEQDLEQIKSQSYLFTVEDLQKMATLLPDLEYLNMCYHFDLNAADLSQLRNLKTLVKDCYFRWNGKLNPKATVFQYQLND